MKAERIELTTNAEVKGFTSLSADGGYTAARALVSILSGNGMFRVDGGNPTALLGHPVSAGDTIELAGEEVSGFKIMQNGTTPLTMFVTYTFGVTK